MATGKFWPCFGAAMIENLMRIRSDRKRVLPELFENLTQSAAWKDTLRRPNRLESERARGALPIL